MIKNAIIEETRYRLLVQCAGCEKEVSKYKSQLKPGTYAFCSLSCRNTNYKGVEKEWKHPSYKGPIEHICKGCSSLFYVDRNRPQNRLYCSRSCSAKNYPRTPHSNETKAKLSKVAAEQNYKYSGKVFYNGTRGEIGMRSSWEVKYAEYLDKNLVQWEYEPEGFKLSSGYIYVPDFKLDTDVIIEIKGYWRDDAKAKWDLFCKDYPQVNKKVLMKNDLKNMGVL